MFSYQNRRGLNRPILRPLWLMTSAAANVISVPSVIHVYNNSDKDIQMCGTVITRSHYWKLFLISVWYQYLWQFFADAHYWKLFLISVWYQYLWQFFADVLDMCRPLELVVLFPLSNNANCNSYIHTLYTIIMCNNVYNVDCVLLHYHYMKPYVEQVTDVHNQ